MTVRHTFTVSEWQELADSDVFGERARMELLDGEIFDMSAVGSPHSACVSRLNHLLATQLADQGIVGIERPVHLDDRSMPQPDFVVLRYRRDFYESAHPQPDDVLPLVEVADTTLAHDLGLKAPLYARTGIGEYWIVDLNAQDVIVLRNPSPGGYAYTQRFGRSRSITIEALPHLEVAVADLLAPTD